MLTKKEKLSQHLTFIVTAVNFHMVALEMSNLFAVFAVMYWANINKTGKAGFIVPPGLATDDTYKEFIKKLINSKSLESFYDFTNRGYLFREVESTMSFALYTISKGNAKNDIILGAKLWQVEHLNDRGRTYTLSQSDIQLLNPNTENLPIFHSDKDVFLIKRIYSHLPILSFG